jgi:hypothetical protein
MPTFSFRTLVIWFFIIFITIFLLVRFMGSISQVRDIVINEVLYMENATSADLERTHEWVEIYNKGRARSIGGWTISASGGLSVATLPQITLPQGSYLVVHFASGIDDLDFSDAKGDYYTGAQTSVFNDDMDEIALYSGVPSRRTIVDFISWSSDVYQAGIAHDMAVQSAIWTRDQFFKSANFSPLPGQRRRSVRQGQSIGRDKDSTDTDLPVDWDITGGKDAMDNTPRAQNISVFGLTIMPPPPPPPAQAEWTFMVYMDGDNNLESAAFDDLNEMELAPNSALVNTVVLVDGESKIREVTVAGGIITPVAGRPRGGTWRGEIRNDINPDLVSLYPTPADAISGSYYLGERNMGDPTTLKDFIAWGKVNYPAKKYALIIWDHGLGWKAVAYDDTSGNDEMLHMTELTDGLGAGGLDIIGFDACLMAMTEVAYQVAPFGSVMVASEETEDSDGWPYDTILTDLAGNPAMGPRALGAGIVARYSTFYTVDSPDPLHTLSAIDLGGGFSGLVQEVSALGDEMRIGIEDYDTHGDPTDNEQIDIRDARAQTEVFDETDFLDLYDFADKIEASPLKPMYRTNAPLIKARLTLGGAVIIDEKHGAGHPQSHGLSIYFPENQTTGISCNGNDPFDDPCDSLRDISGSPQVIYREDNTLDWGKVPYSGAVPHPMKQAPAFRFPADTAWDEFLHRYYKPVADAGADQMIDRGAIVTLNGSGSSDADGTVTTWVWDLHSFRDEPPLLGGSCGANNEDWECDKIDEANDDGELFGATAQFVCDEPIYNITLSVHDDHNTTHGNHWKSDQDTVIVHCLGEKGGIPRTDLPKESVVSPKDKATKEISQPNDRVPLPTLREDSFETEDIPEYSN